MQSIRLAASSVFAQLSSSTTWWVMELLSGVKMVV